MAARPPGIPLASLVPSGLVSVGMRAGAGSNGPSASGEVDESGDGAGGA